MPFNVGQNITPQTASQNWVAGSTSKSAKYVTNTLAPKQLFTTAAIAAAPLWLSQIQRAGTASYIAGMNRANTNINAIAANIQTNGAANYTQGVTTKQYKYTAAITALLPAIQNIVANLPPRGTLSQNLQRSSQFATDMSKLRGQYRG